MTVRSKAEMTAASSVDAARKDGTMAAQKNALRCNQPKAKTKRLSKVEKRRMAALAGWEKRRKQEQMGGGPAAKKMKLAPSQSAATAASTSNWERRRRKVSTTDAEDVDDGEAESDEEDTGSNKPMSRSEAARRRKSMLAAKAVEESTSSSEEEDEDEEEESEVEEETSRKPLSRSEAARLGWARRTKMLAEAEAEAEEEEEEDSEEEVEEEKPLDRAAAARLGWARRRKMLAEAKEAKGRQVVSKSKKKAPRAKCYSAAARRSAAKRGWDRRKLILCGVDPESIPQKDEPPKPKKVYTAEDRAKSARAGWETSTTMKEKKKVPAWLRSKPREGAKRSRRLAAEDSTDSHEETVRKMNELTSFLKVTRGWMEFHPSSRHGSGTATYGYIPASIASFIRGGTVAKSVVLDHGTLGVHYALDYEGYGGLKQMIDNFGLDYSPYPTDGMLEVSRELLGKRNIQLSPWDLGEDLPWQELEQAEEKKIDEYRNKMGLTKEKEEATGEADDLLFVANISLNDGSDEDQGKKDQNTGLVSDFSFSGGQLRNVSRSTSTDATSVEDDSMRGKLVDKDVIFIQSQSDFKQWSFGIC